MSALILIVEDEPDLATIVDYNLRQDGFRTRIALTGRQGLELAQQEPIPDLILLDLMLPDISGTEVCRTIRRDPRTAQIPVVMATARGDEVDRIVGFEVGADDYIVKPVSMRELCLRIRAILSRGKVSALEENSTLRRGPITIDESAHRVWINDEEIQLTVLEFRLLVTLMARQGRVQSRSQLLNDVWGYDSEVTTRTVDTHVKRLREKLGKTGETVETVRGVGYRFALGSDAPPVDETA